MECGQVLCITLCAPVPCHIDIVACGFRSTSEGVVGIRLTREEKSVIIAMEGEVKNPVE